MKNKIIFGLMLFFLMACIYLASSEEGSSGENLAETLGLDFSLIGEGVDSGLIEDGDSKYAELEFVSEGSYVEIQGNRFENIKPSTDEFKSKIKVSPDGEIIEVVFEVDENGGDYSINGYEFSAPANSKVYCSKGYNPGCSIVTSDTIIESEISVPEGEKFGIVGKNVKLSDGKSFSGIGNMDSSGNIWVDANKEVTLNNIKMKSNGPFVIQFGDKLEYQNAISFSENGFEISSNNKMSLSFEKGNPYFNVGENSVVKLTNYYDQSFVKMFNGEKDILMMSGNNIEFQNGASVLSLERGNVIMNKDFSNSDSLSVPIKVIPVSADKSGINYDFDMDKEVNSLVFDSSNNIKISLDGGAEMDLSVKDVSFGSVQPVTKEYALEKLKTDIMNIEKIEGDYYINNKDTTYLKQCYGILSGQLDVSSTGEVSGSMSFDSTNLDRIYSQIDSDKDKVLTSGEIFNFYKYVIDKKQNKQN